MILNTKAKDSVSGGQYLKGLGFLFPGADMSDGSEWSLAFATTHHTEKSGRLLWHGVLF